jgi:hypothetical protein
VPLSECRVVRRLPLERAQLRTRKKMRPSDGRLAGLLDIDPSAVTPVTVAFVLAPPVLLVLGPFPVVWMDGQLEIGMIVVPLDVPAIALGIARDFC